MSGILKHGWVFFLTLIFHLADAWKPYGDREKSYSTKMTRHKSNDGSNSDTLFKASLTMFRLSGEVTWFSWRKVIGGTSWQDEFSGCDGKWLGCSGGSVCCMGVKDGCVGDWVRILSQGPDWRSVMWWWWAMTLNCSQSSRVKYLPVLMPACIVKSILLLTIPRVHWS